VADQVPDRLASLNDETEEPEEKSLEDWKPRTTLTLQFKLFKSFLNVVESQGSFMYYIMHSVIIPDQLGSFQLIGSLIYEDPQTGDINLNFYSTSSDSIATERNDYP
jgi:hypothetical protein